MKKFFVILIGTLLLLSACAAPAEEPEAPPAETMTAPITWPELEELRQRLTEEDAFCGLIYLGRVLEDEDPIMWLQSTGATETYPVLKWVTALVQHGGPELYCLVPREGAAVTVQDWVCNAENHYQGVPGETLYESVSGEPVLFQCNVSDIIPDLHLHIVNPDGETMDYEPSLSLCDGSIDLPVRPLLLDWTDYTQR